MIRSLFIIVWLISVASQSWGQGYGFEWIDYNQTYYKIPVGKEGMYKITYDQLVEAGVPVSSVDPRKIQIFHRGIEQAVLVEGELDARLDPQDYVVFYGQKNDGTLDRYLYEPAEAQPHPYYNLYSDTTVYFLTWKFTGGNGKRIQTFKETNTSGIPAEKAHFPTIRKINNEQYSGGRTFSDYTQYSQFDIGEGWTGTRIQENRTIQYTLSGINNGLDAEGKPIINVFLQGRDDILHEAEISVGSSAANLRVLGSETFNDYGSAIFSSSIEWMDLSASGTVLVQVKALGPEGNDLLSISYLEITYPKKIDQLGQVVQKYSLRENTAGKSFLNVSNVPGGTVFYDITNKDALKIIGYDISGNDALLVVPGTEDKRTLLAVSEYDIPSLQKINFRRYNPGDAEFVIVTHPLLMGPAGNYDNAITAYASYRSSVEGGSYDTLVADIHQLYDQFNYGEISPLAIFNFVSWLKATASPQHLFFIGEGLEVLYNYHRKPNEYNFKDLVPTAGLPASDIVYSAGREGFTHEPSIPTGRLTASTPQQVINYLEKVKVMEKLPYDNLWRKRVLHLSGGIRDSELVNFRFFMNGFAEIAEGPYLGGKVKTIQKNSRTTSEFINIADEVNQGVNLVTFFGHSAPSVTDIDIGFVTNPILGYNNKDKYPVFLINGCNVGQFFLNNFLFGEDWIMAADKGAIGFIAHTSFGYPYDLRDYSNAFYNVGYGDEIFIEKKLGEIQKEAIHRLAASANISPAEVATNQQMMLLGDPATLLFGAEQPDYALEEGSIFISSFDGSPVTVLSDSFAVNVIVKNYGKAPTDSVEVRLQRTIETNPSTSLDTLFKAVLFQDTLSIIVKRNGLEDFGNNNFLVSVDPDNNIPELNEGNNTLGYTYFLQLNATRNLLPYDYAVIDETLDEVIIQATDLFTPTRTFQVQLDTSSGFNSPNLLSESINKKLLANWKPSFIDRDTITYFLRSKFADAVPGEVDEWYTTSFTRIKGGSVGWGQRKTAQFMENNFSGLFMDPSTGKLNFQKTVLPVSLRTIGSQHPDDQTGISILLDDTEYNINNQRRCRDNTLNIIAFNKETAVPYAPIPFVFLDPRTCGRQPQVINSFLLNELSTGNGDDMEEVINRIGQGDSVLLFTIGDPEFSSWNTILKGQLELLGISMEAWNDLINGEPVIIKAKKGAPAGGAEIVRSTNSPAQEQELISEMTFTGISSSGQMKTKIIGPAVAWHNLSLSSLKENSDELRVHMEAIPLEGDHLEVMQTSDEFEDISFIDASNYPYIRLTAFFSDATNLTPATLEQWYVTYAPAAEGIILPDAFNDKKELQEGDSLSMTASFYNLSPWNFTDSLQVNYLIRNKGNLGIDQKEQRIKGPESGDTTYFKMTFSTLAKEGENEISIDINPRIVAEQYYENNQLSAPDFLMVNRDMASPLLDVRFDGRHIFNRDIVSPNPLISVVLKDENPFLIRQDTTGIQLFIKKGCDGCVFERVAFSSDKVNTHSDGERNDFTIEYSPGPLEDGIYTLRIQAADVSGNMAGEGPYEIEFEVINESMVTNFYPYPNPFSSSVRFIFTLTGNELPDQMLIRIMTVSGKIVKEIPLSEFGLLRIGNNISNYAWDGRDEFGDQLANGVYLYKVIIKKGGKEVNHRASAGDELFKNGYGKLYLLR